MTSHRKGRLKFLFIAPKGATMSLSHKPITPDRFDAVLFDLDGVLTSTAKIHSSCWKTMFDDFLRHRAAEKKEPFRPFDIATDYKRYVDGKLRYDGVRSFLASRDITLAEGAPEDPPTAAVRRCSSRRPGCGTTWAFSPSARTDVSASTALPGRTNTPRWSTTTLTRT